MDNEEKIEKLASLVHEQWAHWMKYMIHKKTTEIGTKSIGGVCNQKYIQFDMKDYERWLQQMETPYSELTDKEKESDREWARKYLKIINSD